MSPNPTTVYAEDYDAGCDETLVIGPDGRGCLPSGLADGPGGGNADDFLTADVDDAKASVDTNKCVEQVAHIAMLEIECQHREAVWLKLKADCKAAYAELDAAQARLRSYIRGLSVPMPLFDGDSHVSPAGENADLDGLDDSDAGQQAESSRSGDGSEETVSIGLRPGAADAASSGNTDDNEGWKATELRRIFPSSLAAKFEAAELRTIGELSDFFATGKTYADIKGIGPSKQSQAEDCLEEFWRQWQAA